MKNRVLLVCYLFPPCGGAGVQRNAKYCKYLPRLGWQPTVLTVKDIVYHSYDESLLSDLSSDVKIVRAGSLDPLRLTAVISKLISLFKTNVSSKKKAQSRRVKTPKNNRIVTLYRFLRDWFLVPDASVGWVPFAVYAGVAAVRRDNIQVIVGSVGPYSNALVAYLVSRITGKPYVLDFRDGWIDDPALHCPTAVHAALHKWLEKIAITGAQMVCVYGSYQQNIFMERYPGINVGVLTNGYDADDFINFIPIEKTERRLIVYTGTLYGNYTGFFRQFISDLSKLPSPVLEKIEVVIVGRVEIEGAEAIVAEEGLGSVVRFEGYVSHAKSIGFLQGADALLFGLPEDNVIAYSGKIFEYMMAKKPIISYVNTSGMAADLLREIGCDDWIAGYGNEYGLTTVLSDIDSKGWALPETPALNTFSREALTERFAQYLLQAVDTGR